jgi:6-phosphogluconate dehydrogenase
MKIAVSGLGKIGSQIARKLAEGGHEVIAHNRSRGPIDEAVKHAVKAAYSKQDVIEASGGQPIVIWIMLPEKIMDGQIDEWLKIIPRGSVLVDGGNSDFRRFDQRAERLKNAGCSFMDIGTSGGVWGYKRGFCMMVGGDRENFRKIEPALKTLAAPEGGYGYFGMHGAGHFVKMVHNAIEYGMMESLAEGYRIMKEGPVEDLDLARAGALWQKGSVITSWLNELSASVLSESPELKGIDGIVAESGEARWTLEVAKEIGLPMPAIQAAFDVRLASQRGEVNFGTKLLSAMRHKFGGHEVNSRNP